MPKKHRKKVGLTYDLKTDYIFKEGDPPDKNAEFDHPNTIDVISDAIESAGHIVHRIGNIHNLIEQISSLDVDIVFNICEGTEGRNRESQVPMMLELKGIPYVGADALSQGLTLDKILAKNILRANGIPTPGYIQIKNPLNMNGAALSFPLIVKPRFEGSSKGLNNDSVVKDRKSLLRQAKRIIDTYNQPALAEEFISGQEFTVAVIGNNKPKAMPVVQIEIDGKLQLDELFYTFPLIHSDAIRYICPARISKRMQKRLQHLAIETYLVTECRDFGRVDIRVDKDKNPFVLEINPLPSLSTEDVFGVLGKYLKVGYNRMILDVLEAGLKRYGL
jgi:D-alanine-D-alanine ligase